VVALAKKSCAALCLFVPQFPRSQRIYRKPFTAAIPLLPVCIAPFQFVLKMPFFYGVQEVAGSNPAGPIFFRRNHFAAEVAESADTDRRTMISGLLDLCVLCG
jgi:hypothetical protein